MSNSVFSFFPSSVLRLFSPRYLEMKSDRVRFSTALITPNFLVNEIALLFFKAVGHLSVFVIVSVLRNEQHVTCVSEVTYTAPSRMTNW